MAITGTHLTTAGNGTDASSFATASVSPTASRILIIAIQNSHGTTPATPTVTGLNLTWTERKTQLFATNLRRLTVFTATSGAIPGSGALTIDFAAATQTVCGWSLSEFSEVSALAPVVQAVGNAANSNTGEVALAAFADAVNNATYGAFAGADNTTASAGTDFTLLGTAAFSSPLAVIASEWRLGEDTSVDMALGGSQNYGGIAMELAAGSSDLPATGGKVPRHTVPSPLNALVRWRRF